MSDKTLDIRKAPPGKRSRGPWITVCGLIMAATLAASGCTTRTFLPREEIPDGVTFKNTNVVTNDGLEYQFDRVTAVEDSLIGEYTVEVQRHSPENGIYYEDIVRSQGLPLDRVESLAMKKRDAGKTFFFGAGVAALGFFINDLTEGALTPGGGGSSKSKPDPNG